MKSTTVVAFIGVVVALIDTLGLAKFVELYVHKLIGRLPGWATSIFEKGNALYNWMWAAIVILMMPILVLALYDWLTGSQVVEAIRTGPFKGVGDQISVLPILVLLLTLLIAGAAWGAWWILRILAWPRQGVVSTVGLLLALVGLGLELVHEWNAV